MEELTTERARLAVNKIEARSKARWVAILFALLLATVK